MSLPFLNTAPARTSATRWGALTARHRVCADSMSLNAIATPAAREPGPLVTAFFAPGWADLGSALSTLPILCHQHRCSRVSGNTSRTADQNRSANERQLVRVV